MKDKRTNKSKSLDIHMMVFDRVKNGWSEWVKNERVVGSWKGFSSWMLAVHIAIPISFTFESFLLSCSPASKQWLTGWLEWCGRLEQSIDVEKSPVDVSRGCVLDFNQKKFSLLIFVYLFLFCSEFSFQNFVCFFSSEIFVKARLKGFPFQIIYTSINLDIFVLWFSFHIVFLNKSG